MFSKGWQIEISRPTGLERITLGAFVVRIGSDPDNFLRLQAGPAAAPHHCQLEPFSAGFVLRDTSGGLGVKVNGLPVETAILRADDRIEVADQTLIVHYLAPPQVPAALAIRSVKPDQKPPPAPPASVEDWLDSPPPPVPAAALPREQPGPAVAAYADSGEAKELSHRRHRSKRILELGPLWILVVAGLFALLALFYLLQYTLPANQPRINTPDALWRKFQPTLVPPTPERE